MDDDESSSSQASVARYSQSGARPHELSKLVRLLCHDDTISSKEHVEAAELLLNIQTSLHTNDSIEKSFQVKLVCIATSLLRRIIRIESAQRWAASSGMQTGVGDMDQIPFQRTLMLVFVTIVKCDLVARGSCFTDQYDTEKNLADITNRTSWSEISKACSKRRMAPPQEIDELERQRLMLEEIVDRPFFTNAESRSWATLPFQPGLTACAALQVAGTMMRQADVDLSRLEELSMLFARSTVAQMQSQVLRSRDDREFLTLSTSQFVSGASEDLDEALLSVVLAGESESGQSVRALAFNIRSVH